jgi:DNA-binding Lrp family transcriptional regulator
MAKKKVDSESVQDAIKALLGLSGKAEFGNSGLLKGLEVQPDLIIRNGNTTLLIEVKSAPTLRSLSSLTLMRDLLGKREDVEYVLASKYIPSSVAEAAKRIGVRVIMLPSGLSISNDSGGGKITTAKAWRAVSRLLEEKTCSIRKIAQKEELSYGWTYSTIKKLEEIGVVARDGFVVKILNPDALLNVVAWERSLEDLRIGTIKTVFTSVQEAAEALSSSSNHWDIPLAFTGLTAATAYSGYSAKHDAAYCYINKENFEMFKNDLSGNGIDIIFYKPDRDVFKDARVLNGVKLVSPSQTLLDLAGMGYVARDTALEMVRRYADIATHSH